MTGRAILPAAIAGLGAAAVFTLWPGIDLAVSAAFHDPATGVWLGETRAWPVVREALWKVTEVSAVFFLVLFLLALPRRALVPARLPGFALTALALGPGLVVNGLLKAFWGRARPRNVTEFGGSAEFTPALWPTDQCAGNCSFVAGEVAGWATLAMVLWLLAVRRLDDPARTALGALLVAAVSLTVFLRIAAGGHFLSDTVFAVVISVSVTLALWRLFRCDDVADRLTAATIAADLRRLLPTRRPK